MMRLLRRVLSAAVALCIPVSLYAGDVPGLWRFTIHYEIISVPQIFPSYEKTQCLTEESMFPDISRAGQECSSQPRGRFGNMQTWQLDCSSDQENAQGVGRITFNKGRASGDVHIQILNPFNPPEFMVFRIEGKRLGACTK